MPDSVLDLTLDISSAEVLRRLEEGARTAPLVRGAAFEFAAVGSEFHLSPPPGDYELPRAVARGVVIATATGSRVRLWPAVLTLNARRFLGALVMVALAIGAIVAADQWPTRGATAALIPVGVGAFVGLIGVTVGAVAAAVATTAARDFVRRVLVPAPPATSRRGVG